MTRRAVPVLVLVPLLVVALAVSSSACGTIMNFAGNDPPLPFGGVVSDVQGVVEAEPIKNPCLLLITPFVLADVCLSAVFDAATLPVVGWMQIRAALDSSSPPGRPPVSGPLVRPDN